MHTTILLLVVSLLLFTTAWEYATMHTTILY